MEDCICPLRMMGCFVFFFSKDFSACTAVTLGDACDDGASDHREITTKVHVIWGHASARQLERALVGSEGGNPRMVNFANEALEHC